MYQLAEKYRKLNEYVEAYWDTEDLNEDDLQLYTETLESIDDMIETKVENTIFFLKNIEGDIKAFKVEEERLAKRRKYLQNKFDGLKEFMCRALEVNGIQKVKAGTFSVSLQKNNPSVFILNEALIPEEFRERQPDKIKNSEILKLLKDGVHVEGATLAPEKKHLKIR
ncbi:siphovirus Gp157 family protein [Paenibacillus sp. GCM10027627]